MYVTGRHLFKGSHIEVDQGTLLPRIGSMEGEETWQIEPSQLAGISGILGQQAYPGPSFWMILPRQCGAQVFAHHFLHQQGSFVH